MPHLPATESFVNIGNAQTVGVVGLGLLDDFPDVLAKLRLFLRVQIAPVSKKFIIKVISYLLDLTYASLMLNVTR